MTKLRNPHFRNNISARNKGLALLEFALLLPLLLILIFGAIDINRALQAYGALQQGTAEALRCLYPTDGLCRGAGAAAPPPLYRVEVRPAGAEDRWPVDYFNYQGEGSWLQLPAWELANPRARVLDRLRFEIPYQSYQEQIGINAAIEYFIRTEGGPLVNTGVGHENPAFLRASGANYPPADFTFNIRPAGGAVSGNRGAISALSGQNSSNSELLVGTVRFTIPPFSDQMGERPCFEMLSGSDPANRLPDFQSRCAADLVPVTFHVSGISNSTFGAEGSVRIYLDQPGRYTNYHLGGRLLSSAYEGSFVARGAPLNRISSVGHYSEYQDYAGLRLLRGKPVTISFKLLSNNGGLVGWEGGQIRVFLPTYRKVESKLNCATGGNCPAVHPGTGQAYPPEVFSDLSPECYAAWQQERGLTTICHDPLKPLPSREHRCGVLSYQPVAVSPAAEICAKQAYYEKPCPVDKHGFARNLSAAAALAAAQALCPLDPAAAPYARNITFTEKTLLLPLANPLLYVRNDCQAPAQPGRDQLPPELAAYPQLSWGSVQPVAGPVLATGAMPPARYKDSAPRYNCPEIKTIKQRYAYVPGADPQPPTLTENSLFFGVKPEICGDEAARREAEAHGLPAEAFFQLQRTKVATVLVDERPGWNCYQNTRSDNDPAMGWQLLPGLYSETELPEQCASQQWQCRKHLAAFEQAPDTAPDGAPEMGAEALAWSAAQRLGLDTIQAIMPSAKAQCRGATCVNLELQATLDGAVVGTAAMELPLLLGVGPTVQLTHRQEISLER